MCSRKTFSVDLHRSTVTEWCREIVASPVPEGVRGAFRATEAARNYVDRWIAARGATGKVVTITVRHYAYSPARNSNLAAWARFADYLLLREGYLPVFVPDTESLPEGVPAEVADCPEFVEGAVNLGLRLALYERAFVNLGINNGPAFLYLVDELAAGIVFKIITPGRRGERAALFDEAGIHHRRPDPILLAGATACLAGRRFRGHQARVRGYRARNRPGRGSCEAGRSVTGAQPMLWPAGCRRRLASHGRRPLRDAAAGR